MPVQVALLETNPYLLALTIVVSIVHSVFEFLAFKNGESRGEAAAKNCPPLPAVLSEPTSSW